MTIGIQMDIDILSYVNDDQRNEETMPYGQPILTKLGGRIDVAVICSGVNSLRVTSDECKENIVEIDCYYEGFDNMQIHAVIMVPLSELITITELYELAAMRNLGELAFTTELPYSGGKH